MPSIASYTPYETLTLFQTVAHRGVDETAFDNISLALNANDLIREDAQYDASRLTAAALKGLFDELIDVEAKSEDVQVNGDTNATGRNPRKRKLSTSDDEIDNHGHDLVPTLVDKLYVRFREKVIKEIREDEEQYAQLQDEIKDLESQVENQREVQHNEEPEAAVATTDDTSGPPESKAETVPAPATQDGVEQAQPVTAAQDIPQPESRPQQQPPDQYSHPRPSSISQSPLGATAPPPLPRQISNTPQPLPAHPSPVLNQHGPQQSSPGAFHRTLPPPSPQRPGYGPVPVQHAYGPHGQPVPLLPPPTGMSPVQAGMPFNGPKIGQSRGSPHLPPPSQQYVNYQQYPPPHQWQHQPPSQQYPQHSPYPYPPYHAASPGPAGRSPASYQTPHQSPYPMYAPTGPYPAQPPPAWQGPRGSPYLPPPYAVNTPPIPRPQLRQSLAGSSTTSTPWKRTPRPSSTLRPPSPARREREVSPLSDRGSPAPQLPSRKSPVVDIPRPTEQDASRSTRKQTRRGRDASVVSSTVDGSRSQSLVSDQITEPTSSFRRIQQIKDEPFSTPAPMSVDPDPPTRQSSRRGRPRNSTITSRIQPIPPSTTTKRKRSSTRPSSPTPSLPSHPATSNHPTTRQNPNLVAVSRNFAKTAHLLLSEITSHKLGGIFAKPLSEREAPGYKDLVLRPQDLKSIKTAVSKGSRAATAAIDALESNPNPPDSDNVANEAAGGTGVFWVSKTEELVPPKGIVNSSQLETELVRMFANAVMFNPLPTEERGFGRGLKLRSGKVLKTTDNDDDDDNGSKKGEGAEESEQGSEETLGDNGDEGGIIADAREMFKDVKRMVGKWREVEDERVGGQTTTAGVGIGVVRQGSVSFSETRSRSSQVPEDDKENNSRSSVAATPTVEIGTRDIVSGSARGRKRRKVAE